MIVGILVAGIITLVGSFVGLLGSQSPSTTYFSLGVMVQSAFMTTLCLLLWALTVL